MTRSFLPLLTGLHSPAVTYRLFAYSYDFVTRTPKKQSTECSLDVSRKLRIGQPMDGLRTLRGALIGQDQLQCKLDRIRDAGKNLHGVPELEQCGSSDSGLDRIPTGVGLSH